MDTKDYTALQNKILRDMYSEKKSGICNPDLPFGEKTVMGDTLTWDGNTEGLETNQYVGYKLTNIAPTLSDVEQGVIGTDLANGASVQCEVVTITDTVYALQFGGVETPQFVVVTEDTTENGITATKGFYSTIVPEHPMKLTINGYNGFPRTEITPIPKKYLPESHQFGTEIERNVLFDGEVTTDNFGNFSFDKTLDIEVGKKYKVDVDGVEYLTNEAWNDYDEKQNVFNVWRTYDPATGSGDILCVVGENSVWFDGVNTTHTLKVYTEKEVVTKIKEEYLPNTVVRSVNGRKPNENGNVDILIRFTTLGYINQITDRYDKIGNAELVLIKDTRVHNTTGVDFDGKPLLIALLSISGGIREFYALGFNGKQYMGGVNLSNYTLSISELTS